MPATRLWNTPLISGHLGLVWTGFDGRLREESLTSRITARNCCAGLRWRTLALFFEDDC